MKWIKVTNRMPHYGQEVIVYPVYSITPGQPDYIVGTRYVLNDGNGNSYFQFDEHYMITHWMPLPEAP